MIFDSLSSFEQLTDPVVAVFTFCTPFRSEIPVTLVALPAVTIVTDRFYYTPALLVTGGTD